MQRTIWSICTNHNPNFQSRQIYFNSHLFNIGPGSDSQIGEFFETHSNSINLLFLSSRRFCRNPVFALTFNLFFQNCIILFFKKKTPEVGFCRSEGYDDILWVKIFSLVLIPQLRKICKGTITNVYNLAVHEVAVVRLNLFERRRENKFKRRRNRAIWLVVRWDLVLRSNCGRCFIKLMQNINFLLLRCLGSLLIWQY